MVTTYLKKSLFLVTGLALLASCAKEEATPVASSTPTKTSEIVAPRNFAYSTVRPVNFNLQIQNAVNSVYKVELSDEWPYLPTARVLYTGLTGSNGQLQKSIQLSATVTEVYVKITNPGGSAMVTKHAIAGNSLFVVAGKTGSANKTTTLSPNCTSGCTTTLTSPSGNITANNGGTTCLTGTFNGGITVSNNSTLRICGTATIQWGSINNGCKLEITSGATVTVLNLNFNGSSPSFENWSNTVTFSSNLAYSGNVTNHGTLTVNQDFNMNAGTFTNNGILTVGQNMNINGNNGLVTNYGSIYVANNFQKNGNNSTELHNYCSLVTGNELIINSDNTFNYSYMKAGTTFRVNSGAIKVRQENSALISCTNLVLNSEVIGIGSMNSIKVTNNTTINGSGKISGNLELCDLNGVETINGTNNIVLPAAIACTNFIPTDGCNTEGIGTPAIVDTDGDGIADALDEYPTDPARAMNVYYPSQSQYGSLVYEDLWPYLGDFDFNDLVVDYRHQLVANAAGNIVELKSNFAVRAIGAGKHNGFAFILDNAPSSIASITGFVNTDGFFSVNANGTENGQTKSVIPVFSDAFLVIPNTGTEYVNTKPGELSYAPDTVKTVVTFVSPVAESTLGSWPYNPFIMDNANRGKEVHLADKSPSEMANTSLLGTGDDDSNSGSNRYYKNKNNLPWALHLVDGFAYPAEKVDILGAYPYFGNWAQTGGISYPTWYADLPGYRDASKLY